MGSYHDGIIGISDSCPITNNYLMVPSPGSSNPQNLFDMSDCSRSQIKGTILTGGGGIYG